MADLDHTKYLANYCTNLRLENLPAEVLKHTKHLLLDLLGLAAKGLSLSSTKQIHALIRKIGGVGTTTVIGTGMRVLPQYAALANATSSHSLSLDDIYAPASIHPGSGIFAAALAVTQFEGRSGKNLMESVIAGYEATLRIADAINSEEHYSRGWHPTATCGTFGATIATANILRMKTLSATNALGIAGSMVSGSMAFLQNGTWTKRIHAGLASQRGIQAAYLANEGFIGPQAILEGKYGFLNATSFNSTPSFLTDDLGKKLRILDTGIKNHACCRYNQSAVDAAIDLKKTHSIDPEKIESIKVEIFRAAFPIVVDPWEEKIKPINSTQAQFSLPYTVATALIKEQVSTEEFTQEALNNPEIQRVISKITVAHNPDFDTVFPDCWPSRVHIKMSDGNEIVSMINYPKGDVNNPLSDKEMLQRFRHNSSPVFDKINQEKIIETVGQLEELKDIRELTELLRR